MTQTKVIPFHGTTELDEGNLEWQRRLRFEANGIEMWILCCPEDVRRSSACKHDAANLCKNCEIPLCQKCEHKMEQSKGTGCCIPMGLCNDNYWGYTSDIISKYQVRWIEAAIVNPCWTSLIVYYVEGDAGHLMNEEVGKQKFRTVVRGSCCSYQMPWEDLENRFASGLPANIIP